MRLCEPGNLGRWNGNLEGLNPEEKFGGGETAMRKRRVRALLIMACLSLTARAQCGKDNREDPKAGILVTDFTITGTQTVSATELAGMTGELTGSCFNDDSDEMGERVRALFQNRGTLRRK